MLLNTRVLELGRSLSEKSTSSSRRLSRFLTREKSSSSCNLTEPPRPLHERSSGSPEPGGCRHVVHLFACGCYELVYSDVCEHHPHDPDAACHPAVSIVERPAGVFCGQEGARCPNPDQTINITNALFPRCDEFVGFFHDGCPVPFHAAWECRCEKRAEMPLARYQKHARHHRVGIALPIPCGNGFCGRSYAQPRRIRDSGLVDAVAFVRPEHYKRTLPNKPKKATWGTKWWRTDERTTWWTVDREDGEDGGRSWLDSP